MVPGAERLSYFFSSLCDNCPGKSEERCPGDFGLQDNVKTPGLGVAFAEFPVSFSRGQSPYRDANNI